MWGAKRGGCLGDDGDDVIFVDGEFLRRLGVVGVQNEHLRGNKNTYK
jgi:hypothetical protein